MHQAVGIVLGLMAALLPAGSLLAGEPLTVLVFTRTEGFAHPSIADGVSMIMDIGLEEGHTVMVTDDTAAFTPSSLALHDVVIWLSTTGDVLDDPEQNAFEGFMRAGGGYVGIHAAADCEYDWPWYGDLLGGGAWFNSHPAIQTATLELENPDHPGAGFTEPTTPFEDEWYNFRENPRADVDVIMTLDETSYDPGSGAMGPDHPIVWAHDFGGGRVFYTGLGHRSETYGDVRFKDQIRGAIRWAAGATVFADGFESGDTSAWSASAPPREPFRARLKPATSASEPFPTRMGIGTSTREPFPTQMRIGTSTREPVPIQMGELTTHSEPFPTRMGNLESLSEPFPTRINKLQSLSEPFPTRISKLELLSEPFPTRVSNLESSSEPFPIQLDGSAPLSEPFPSEMAADIEIYRPSPMIEGTT